MVLPFDELFEITYFDDETSKFLGKTSFFRNTHPDYSLRILRTSSACDISEYCFYIKWREQFDEEYVFHFNVGDLFIMAVNLFNMECKFDTIIQSLSENVKRCIDKFISIKPTSPLGEEYLKIFREAEDAKRQMALYASFYKMIHEWGEKDEYMRFSFLGLAVDDVFKNTENSRIQADALKKAIFDYPFLNSILMRLRLDRDKETEYLFSGLWDAVIFDLHEMLKRKVIISKCENCGELFVPTIRSDEKYCDYSYLGSKSCKQIGYENKVKNDDVLSQYRKIYKTQNARKQRNSHLPNITERFKSWAEFAKCQLELCQNGDQSLESMVAAISGDSWLREVP